ncbi:MAG TPA: hypothetical protein VM734_36015 [Kofleriaceae bacterium]|nr:hypothetical protein [Kofleriaceae bacterium]
MLARITASSLPLLLTASLAGCGDDDPDRPGGGGGGAAPRYAVQSMIFGDQGTWSYVSLLPSLETQAEVKLTAAREFPGYAPADAWGGAIIVGSGEAPTLTRYAVDDAGTWVDEGTVSFANFTTMPLDGSVYVTPIKAYVPIDTTNHVVWDPETVTIGAAIGAPAQIPLTRDGLTAWRGYGHEVRDGKVFQPYYFADASFQAYSGTSQVAVIDATTDTVSAVIDVPCPHLHITSQDDDGNIYLSNGQGSIAAAVLGADQPKNCFARIKAGETTLDPSFTTRFRDLTDGREGSNLFYVGDGVALINVYHAERDDLGPDTPYETVDYSSSYHLWTLDLATMQARPVDGLDYGGGQFVAFRIDGRMFVAIPAADYSRTAVYEVLASGAAEKRFDTEGWTFKIFRVR